MRKIRYALPLLCWVLLLAVLSSQSYHKQTIIPYLKGKVTKQELSAKVPDLRFRYGRDMILAKQSPYEFVEFVFRKAAHLFVYAMLGGLGYIALLPYRLPKGLRFLLAFLLVAFPAFLDELNQTHSTMRKGTLQDVGLDCVGGLIGLLLCKSAAVFWQRTKSKAVSS
ncbi:VanZ family protein [Paenibacillus sp. GD4]|jgi:VanZ family protein|uniref:VanZ family protein n=1 Tax=Paenibacillus sp. GD4 TaxID=3068890 RepID=UPI0027965BA4|nr:VanZ family protein [Paenibacillus sp. GD4]MDQ1910386.1 VanZ family protein [Paenibacillus sp. GD4]